MMRLVVFFSLVLGVAGQAPGPPKAWQLLYRQQCPALWKAGELSINPDDESAPMFAILDKIDSFKSKAGGFNFKIRWADIHGDETMHWKQTSNPFLNRTSGVVGYEAISCPQTANAWGGLEYDTGKHCLMDGSPGIDSWFYCIGYNGADWGQPKLSFPSYNRPAFASELFAMDPKTKKWVLVFRQTLPHLINQWSLNEKNPNNESYAILDNLENFRNPADGKLELKMNWPDHWNVWHQTNNPVTAKPATGAEVDGYKAIDVQFTGAQWGGLEPDLNPGQAILQGSVANPGTWFYAIGYMGIDWGEGIVIPAYGQGPAFIGSKIAELYVEIEA